MTSTLPQLLRQLLYSTDATFFSSIFHISALRRLHAHLAVAGRLNPSNPFPYTRLVAAASLAVSGDASYALSLFHSFPFSPPIFVYNSILRALFRRRRREGSSGAAMSLFKRLVGDGVVPNNLTFPFLLRCCSTDLAAGATVHCQAVRRGVSGDVYVVNNGISMYAAAGDMDSARALFDESRGVADVVSWTAIVTACAGAGDLEEAQALFDEMPHKNQVSWNAMLSAYAVAGETAKSTELFQSMPTRDDASWSALLSGYTHSGKCTEALAVFDDMVAAGVEANEAAVVSAVTSCARLRSLDRGERVHAYVKQRGIPMSVILATAILDMYGKCGRIDKAVEIFAGMLEKTIYTWNSVIAGLAMNGATPHAFTMFYKMQLAGVRPNHITFVWLLSACAHAGLVLEGRQLFDRMATEHGVEAIPEHYSCIVHLLGHAGLIREAAEFISNMPILAPAGAWGALAEACRMHGEVELGEAAAKRLIKLEPDDGGRYVLLSSIYESGGRWSEASAVRQQRKAVQAAKGTARSVVQTQEETL